MNHKKTKLLFFEITTIFDFVTSNLFSIRYSFMVGIKTTEIFLFCLSLAKNV